MPNAIAPIYEVETDEGENGLYLPDRQPKKDMRSKLLKSKEAAAGLVVNACPFGCKETDLDEQTYCKHVVGFTDPDDETQYFPMKYRPGQGKVKHKIKFRFVDGDDPRPVQPGDRLVKISLASRVYRPDPGVPEVAPSPEESADA